MSLSNSRVEPTIAVSDMGSATQFYEGKLGLSGGEDQPDGGRRIPAEKVRGSTFTPRPATPARPERRLPDGWSPMSGKRLTS